MVSNLKKLRLFIDFAIRVSQESYCNRLKVGSVIVKNDLFISYGYNGTPKGDDNCCEIDDVTKPNVIHAELNAILKTSNSTESIKDAILIITHSPCMSCASHIVNTEIKHVVYIHDYRDDSGIRYLLTKGINIYQYDINDNSLCDPINGTILQPLDSGLYMSK